MIALPAFAASVPNPALPVVVIDAGHGGYDRGGIPGQRITEKDKCLDVALRLRRILQNNGYKVVMTRDEDVFIPLGTRVAIGNSYRNGIFVSIHFNCSTRIGANGIEASDRAFAASPYSNRQSVHRRFTVNRPPGTVHSRRGRFRFRQGVGPRVR